MTSRAVAALGGIWMFVAATVLPGAGLAVAGRAEPEQLAAFTPLAMLPGPQIVQKSEEYPSSVFVAGRILDNAVDTEYASNGKGTDTFIVFDFGQPVAIAGFQHIDRQDVATIDAAELTFADQPDFQQVLASETIDHVNTPGGTTTAPFREPHTARYVKWKVTQLNAQGHSCVGGREIRFFTAGPPDPTPLRDTVSVRVVQAIRRDDRGPQQLLSITFQHIYAEPADVVCKVGNLDPIEIHLQFGTQSVELQVPAVEQDQVLPLEVLLAGHAIIQQECLLTPVRHWELHFLPHSHVDIGFTHVQTEVEQKQWSYLRQALEIARNTASYPPAARFKWNCEVMWAVDGFLKQASDEEKQAFAQAVRNGVMHLDGLYGNELTALCRPEELMRLVDCARRTAREYDVVVDAAMISDVPGYTWGTVPALVQSGIKYLSIGPNHVHRIGGTLEQWGDRPFYWVSPSGQERLLCWMAGKAYSWFHDSRVGTLLRDSKPDPFFAYLEELQQAKYPYDMVQIRYSIGGDNGPPDQEISEFVKAWNERYVWPQLVISTTSQLMHAFEQRYGDQLPEVRGDFTPYWEDGAASSARETGLTRMASERLVQAEALWALLAPNQYPADDFAAAWREAILYNEHTWGAHCSITEPDNPFTLSQWKIKQQFALQADERSRTLLQQALLRPGLDRGASPDATVTAVDVWNTTSWPRTDLVVFETETPLVGHVVKDLDGRVVPSEMTRRGHLAFVAEQVPPLSARRFLIEPGPSPNPGQAKAEGNVLSTARLRVEIDAATGTISSLRRADLDHEFVARTGGRGLNDYRYVAGRSSQEPQTSRPTRVEVFSSGGLTASLGVFADAPGCRQLITIIRIIDGLDRVDIFDALDKAKILEKESVHFGFPFQVPDGVMRIDIPWAVMQPDLDQLPGACKNYLTVGRWIDVSNSQLGVTWATLDAPLVEVGGIHVDVADPFTSGGWIKQLEPTQTLFSYVMNNYWETNYKASQDGWTTFRYSLLPHGPYDQSAAARFGIERSQPLVVTPARRDTPVSDSRVILAGQNVIVTSLKPSDDGRALLVRLFNPGTEPAQTSLQWREPVPLHVTLSSPREEVGTPLAGPLTLPPLGIVTLRAELVSETR
ncbi:MAG: glycoside hydrolase family 38 N-terminal domain-containing protein [Pirellulaceae bacterium]